jgi:hypothetical protein
VPLHLFLQITKKVKYISWILLLFFGFVWAQEKDLPVVKWVTKADLSQIDSSRMRESLLAEKITPVNQSEYPELFERSKKVKDLLQKLVLPMDSQGPLYFILAEDFGVGASFIRAEGTSSRVVVINAGLLDFVKSDDELAFVIGHELEHGCSEIESYIEKRKSQLKKGSLEELRLNYIRSKTIENEVDVKSVIRRLHQKGFNADQARVGLERIRSAYGDQFNSTHTMMGTRINAVESVLTGMERGYGQQIKTTLQNEVINAETSQSLISAKARQTRELKIREIISSMPEQFIPIYDELFISTGERTKIVETAIQKFDETLKLNYEKIHRLGEGMLNRQGLMEMKVEAYANILDGYSSYREQKFKQIPKNLKNLTRAANFGFTLEGGQLFHGESFSPELPELMGKVRKLQAEQKSLLTQAAVTAEEKLARESRLMTVQKEIDQLSKGVEFYKPFYSDDQTTRKMLEKTSILSSTHANWIFSDRWSGSKFDIDTQLAEKIKVIGPRIAKNRQATVRMLKESLPNMGQEILELALNARKLGTFEPFYSIGYLNASQLEQYYLKKEALKAFTQEWKKRFVLASASEQIKLTRGAVQVVESATFNQTQHLRDIVKDKEDFFRSIRELINTATQNSKTYAALEPWVSEVQGSPSKVYPFDSNHSRSFLTWNEPTTQAWLKPEIYEDYFSKRLELLLAKSKKGRIGILETLKDLDREYDTLYELSQIHQQKEPPKFKERFLDKVIENWKTSSNLPTSLKKDLLALRYGGSPSTVRTDQLLKQISTLFKQDPSAILELKEIIRFDALVDHASSPREKVAVYRFVSEFPELMGRPPQINLERPGQFEKYYLKRRDYLDWAKNQTARSMKAATQMVFDRSNYHFTSSSHHIDDAWKRYMDAIWHERYQKDLAQTLSKTDSARFGRLFKHLYESGMPRDFISSPARIETLSGLKPEVQMELIQSYHRVAAPRETQLIALDQNQVGEFEKNPTTRRRFEKAVTESFFGDIEFTPRRVQSSQSPIERKIKMLDLLLEYGSASAERDRLILELWEQSQTHPQSLGYFKDEKLIGALYFDESKRRLSRWQLAERFPLLKNSPKNTDRSLLGKFKSRDETQEMMATLTKQFPERSFLRDGTVDWVEERMISTVAENTQFNRLRLNQKNWFTSSNLDFIDVPNLISREMKSSYDRLEMVQFLTGKLEGYPQKKMIDSFNGKQRNEIMRHLDEAKAKFVEANIHSRTYFLLPYLDAQTGVLSEPALVREIEKMLLGNQFEDEVVRSLFSAYLDSVPEAQKKAILSHSLASLVESGADAKLSIKAALEAMGPFGIKAGQFIRSSGLASPEIAKDLDGFLDRAVAPSRKKIIEDLKKIFGKKLAHVESVGELVGSGSINYGFRCEILDPQTQQTREVLLRVQRDAVEGLVANENKIWTKAVGQLKSSSNFRLQQMADIIEEGRLSSFNTLKSGGSELDLSIERANYSAAREVYAKEGRFTKSGYSIEVSRPLEDLQALVPVELQKSVSIYEYYRAKSWNSIQDPQLLSQLSGDVVDSEFKALFSGRFDKDGHRGNWLVDVENRRLIRIDYAQLQEVPLGQAQKIKDVLKIVSNPWISSLDAKQLHRNLDALLDVEAGPKPSVEQYKAVLRSPRFPKDQNPQQRIFFVRQELEEILRRSGHPRAQVRFSANLRDGMLSVGKMMAYGEAMPAQEFKQQLAGLIDYRIQDAARSIAGTGLDKIKNLVSLCDPRALFKKLFEK